ncbi:MAG: RuBisCO large subunit C-terminal-like domain-containing protein, partial [Candidatus Methanofastidiosia archaeon]
LPMILSMVAGNLFEVDLVERIKLENLTFPKEFLKSFKGPRFEISGCRKFLKIKKRPLLGCIIKPDIGLNPEEHAELAFKAAVGGCDFVKDDELLGASPKYNPLEERVSRVMEALDRAEEEKGERTMYAVNITDRVDRILKNAEIARENGANCLMLNFVTAGISALRVLSESVKLPIHAHRDMFASFTRIPDHGISVKVLLKLTRMAGGDQIHIGSVDGKLYESNSQVVESANLLRKTWGHLREALPVSSGGIHALKLKRNLELLGDDTLFLAGGGVFSHKMGAEAGAKSLREALEALRKGMDLKEKAKECRELKWVLENWC